MVLLKPAGALPSVSSSKSKITKLPLEDELELLLELLEEELELLDDELELLEEELLEDEPELLLEELDEEPDFGASTVPPQPIMAKDANKYSVSLRITFPSNISGRFRRLLFRSINAIYMTIKKSTPTSRYTQCDTQRTINTKGMRSYTPHTLRKYALSVLAFPKTVINACMLQ